jgi:hypothetical protein
MAEKKKSGDQKTLASLDKRVLDRNVAKGVVSKTDLDAHLKGLPDLADQADNIAEKVWGQGN